MCADFFQGNQILVKILKTKSLKGLILKNSGLGQQHTVRYGSYSTPKCKGNRAGGGDRGVQFLAVADF